MSTALTIDEERRRFEQFLRETTDLADSTIEEYGNKIHKLDRPLDFTGMELEEVLNTLEIVISRGESRSAFKRYLNFLKRRKEWPLQARRDVNFVKSELDDWDLKTSTRLTKSDVMEKYLRVEQVQEFHTHIKRNTRPGAFKDSRRKTEEYKMLPVFLFETAMRIGAALSVKVGNIDFEEKSIILTGKGGKTRKVNIHQSAAPLKQHIDRYDLQTDVFALDRDDDYHALNDRFKRVGQDLFGRAVTAHWFRHSFATNWAIKQKQEGEPVGEVKDQIREYLGHDKVITTEKYIGAAEELMRDNIYEVSGGFELRL